MSDAALASRLEALQLTQIRTKSSDALYDRIHKRQGQPSPAARKGKWIAIGGSGLVLVIALALATNLVPTGQPQAQKSETVATATNANEVAAAPSAAQATPGGQLVAAGFVVPRRAATVGSQITGAIQSIVVSEGDTVAKGQPLAYLDDGSARAALDRTQAQIDVARAEISGLLAQHREASLMLERKAKLIDRGFVTAASVEASQAAVSSLAAQITQAQANRSAAVALARGAVIDRGRYVIRAPFAGVIVSKNAEVGEVVSPISAGGGFTRTGVMTLVDMASLGGEVDVSETHISRVTIGQQVAVTLDAYPNDQFRAVVSAITPTVDRARATIKVKLDFLDRDTRILPQMAIRAIFITKD